MGDLKSGCSWLTSPPMNAVSLFAPPCATLCREGIVDADGQVNVADLLGFIEFCGTDNPAADFDGNGVVSIDDLLVPMAALGPCV